jgi:hypothetical protein
MHGLAARQIWLLLVKFCLLFCLLAALLPCRHLAAVGYDPVYGARPVKRAIQRELETPLAQALLRGQFQVGGQLHTVTALQDGHLGSGFRF